MILTRHLSSLLPYSLIYILVLVLLHSSALHGGPTGPDGSSPGPQRVPIPGIQHLVSALCIRQSLPKRARAREDAQRPHTKSRRGRGVGWDAGGLVIIPLDGHQWLQDSGTTFGPSDGGIPGDQMAHLVIHLWDGTRHIPRGRRGRIHVYSDLRALIPRGKWSQITPHSWPHLPPSGPRYRALIRCHNLLR